MHDGLAVEHHAAQLARTRCPPRPAACSAGRAPGCAPSATSRTSTPTARRRGRTYQSGIRCGRPSRAIVAHVTVRYSARKDATSASVITICVAAAHREEGARSRSAAASTTLAHVRRLEHGGVAGLLEDLLDEVALALEQPTRRSPRRRRARPAPCASRRPSARARARSTRARRASPRSRPSAASPRRRRSGRARRAARTSRRARRRA